MYLGSAGDLFYHDHRGVYERAAHTQAELHEARAGCRRLWWCSRSWAPISPKAASGGCRSSNAPHTQSAMNRLCRGKGMSTTFRMAINDFPWEQRCNCDEIKRWENIAGKCNAFSAITATAAGLFLILPRQQQWQLQSQPDLLPSPKPTAALLLIYADTRVCCDGIYNFFTLSVDRLTSMALPWCKRDPCPSQKVDLWQDLQWNRASATGLRGISVLCSVLASLSSHPWEHRSSRQKSVPGHVHSWSNRQCPYPASVSRTRGRRFALVNHGRTFFMPLCTPFLQSGHSACPVQLVQGSKNASVMDSLPRGPMSATQGALWQCAHLDQALTPGLQELPLLPFCFAASHNTSQNQLLGCCKSLLGLSPLLSAGTYPPCWCFPFHSDRHSQVT